VAVFVYGNSLSFCFPSGGKLAINTVISCLSNPRSSFIEDLPICFVSNLNSLLSMPPRAVRESTRRATDAAQAAALKKTISKEPKPGAPSKASGATKRADAVEAVGMLEDVMKDRRREERDDALDPDNGVKAPGRRSKQIVKGESKVPNFGSATYISVVPKDVGEDVEEELERPDVQVGDWAFIMSSPPTLIRELPDDC
jgi:hypothetical protein